MAGSVRLRRQAAHEIEEHRRSQRIRRPRGALVYGVQEVQEAADYLRPDHTVPYGTVLSRDAVPGTSCQATIGVVPPGRAGRGFTTASGYPAGLGFQKDSALEGSLNHGPTDP
jgi:hypothetical protein